jgi:hypothetical protein
MFGRQDGLHQERVGRVCPQRAASLEASFDGALNNIGESQSFSRRFSCRMITSNVQHPTPEFIRVIRVIRGHNLPMKHGDIIGAAMAVLNELNWVCSQRLMSSVLGFAQAIESVPAWLRRGDVNVAGIRLVRERYLHPLAAPVR